LSTKDSFRAPKGTADLLGSAAAGWDALQQTARRVFARYGYAPVYTPVFEHTEVFARGIGEATDVVGKEMYTFTDRAGRSLTLRPENTAGVVRAAIQAHLTDNGQTAKLFYAGPMFRYERPQKGRQRQFYQLGAEALGFQAPAADAEMVLMLRDFYLTLGLTETRGSASLAASPDNGNLVLLLNTMGCAQCRPAWRDAMAGYIRAHADGLCQECQRRADTNPLRALDCKNPACVDIMAGAPKLADYLCDDCREHFAQVRALLDAAGVVYQLDPTLVRGLDYYTRTVFEFQVADGLGSQNAVGGGGRYDGLFEQLGGSPTPGIGFAIGAERTLLALEAAGIILSDTNRTAVYVACADADLRDTAFLLTTALRAAGVSVVCDLQDKSLKSQFKAADKAGAGHVVIIGADEDARGGVTLRDMQTKTELFVPRDELLAALTAGDSEN
jgi:histidyl-tRNA synthetase